jgi:UDPglucose 6-dehydrogenase
MRVAIIGAGYVGLCTGVGLASIGHEVVCVDKDTSKVEMINSGKSPIYEKGLDELLNRVRTRFSATTDISKIKDTEITFIAVGTPSREDGSIDLTQIEEAARELSMVLDNPDHLVVMKSTVVPGTTDYLKQIVADAGKNFRFAMNPEFLREGEALQDFLNPDSIVVGGDMVAQQKMKELYAPLNKEIFFTDIKTAEMIKYAKNSYLAKDISFANEIANICEKIGIDYEDVRKALAEDKRIGAFIQAGAGYGGSCFGKDVSALIAKAKSLNYEPKLLETAHQINEKQKLRIVEIMEHKMQLSGKTIGILGLAFKPETDDIRDAPSVKIIQHLLEKGTIIYVYDPKAMNNIKAVFGDRINYATKEECLFKDALVILTEWDEFKDITQDSIGSNTKVFDARRILNKHSFRPETYFAIGLGK